MDINWTVLLFIIFLLAPLIEKLLKGGKQQQPPPPPRTRQQRMPPQRPRPELERPAPGGEREAGEPSAADMVPDDLWAILTGEQRPRPTPTQPRQETTEEQRPRQPVPARTAPTPLPTAKRTAPVARGKFQRPGQKSPPVTKRPAPGYDMRGDLPPDEEAVFRRVPPPERAPVEDYVREIPVHRGPEVVSLEELVIDDEKRHATFHDRLAALPRAARVRHDKRHELAQLFREPNELRRAVIMREVLGPPKGLE